MLERKRHKSQNFIQPNNKVCECDELLFGSRVLNFQAKKTGGPRLNCAVLKRHPPSLVFTSINFAYGSKHIQIKFQQTFVGRQKRAQWECFIIPVISSKATKPILRWQIVYLSSTSPINVNFQYGHLNIENCLMIC